MEESLCIINENEAELKIVLSIRHDDDVITVSDGILNKRKYINRGNFGHSSEISHHVRLRTLGYIFFYTIFTLGTEHPRGDTQDIY